MDLVDHPGSLNVVGFVNPGPGADRVGKLFFVSRPELKNGDAHEARFGEIDLVQAIAEVVAAEGHDRARSRDVLLQFLLEAGEFRVSAESLGYVLPRLFDRSERVKSAETKYVRRTCDGLKSEPVDRNLGAPIAPHNFCFRLFVCRFLAGTEISAIEEKRVGCDPGFR